jgi:hypothetical protein
VHFIHVFTNLLRHFHAAISRKMAGRSFDAAHERTTDELIIAHDEESVRALGSAVIGTAAFAVSSIAKRFNAPRTSIVAAAAAGAFGCSALVKFYCASKIWDEIESKSRCI